MKTHRLGFRQLVMVALVLWLGLVGAGNASAQATALPPSDAAAIAAAPSPPRVESRTFWSVALERSMPYLIYLPPGYDSRSSARYPVVYMLHGIGGSHTEWRDNGLLDTADRMIRDGDIAPMIIVLPEGDRAYWVDHANGGPRWGTYMARDVVADVDANFRTRADRGHRAIGGLSMGAHGALQLALNHPDVFSVVGAHSVVLRRHETAPAYFGDAAYFAAHDPVQLVRARPDVARALALWVDSGQQDPWHPVAEAFHRQLEQVGIPHIWHPFPGGHSGEYWAAHAGDYLAFYDDALAG